MTEAAKPAERCGETRSEIRFPTETMIEMKADTRTLVLLESARCPAYLLIVISCSAASDWH